jgi:hypothetical protein
VAVVRLTFETKQIGEVFTSAGQVILDAARAAADDVLDAGLEEGRDNIRSASGNFGSRWWMGLDGKVTKSGSEITVRFTHDIPYFWVHQEGATIVAKSGRSIGGVPQMWFEDTRRSPFHLVHVPRVTIPKRFRVKEVLIDVMSRFPQFYTKRTQDFRR